MGAMLGNAEGETTVRIWESMGIVIGVRELVGDSVENSVRTVLRMMMQLMDISEIR